MNLKSFLSASVVCVVGLFGVVACSSTPDDDGQGETGESSQALCRRGMNCAPPGGGSTTVVDEEPPVTFTCPRKVEYPCGPVLKCTSAGVCTCQNSCTGGGYGTSIYNPCPWDARKYTCNWYGACSCTS